MVGGPLSGFGVTVTVVGDAQPGGSGVVVGRYVMLLPALVAQDSADLVAAIGPTLQRYLDGEAQ